MSHSKLALAALFGLATPALAQTMPPDITHYAKVTPTYAAGDAPNVLGDGSTPSGGTPPALADRPRRVLSPVNALDRLTSPDLVNYVDCPSYYVSGTTCEMKFRTNANFNHINFDDPIRLWGKPGQSHCHDWAGNVGGNAFSTYTSLRNRPDSTVGGYWLNASGYWEPCVVKGGSVVQPDNSRAIAFYYSANNTLFGYLTMLPRGLRFIGGVNMDDPEDARVKAEIAAANAQPGTAGRYEYYTNGFGGWACIHANQELERTADGHDESLSFVKSDGSDPWAGKCGEGDFLIGNLDAPECWDGRNLWSPDGYSHFRFAIIDRRANKPYPLDRVCPQGWYRMPHLIARPQFRIGAGGFADYRTWKLSSDDMAAAAAGHAMLPGTSFHFDWMYGWDDHVIETWQVFCLGIGAAMAHTCNYSTIDATHRMLSDSPSPERPTPKYNPMVGGGYPHGTRDVPLGSGAATGSMTGMHRGQ